MRRALLLLLAIALIGCPPRLRRGGGGDDDDATSGDDDDAASGDDDDATGPDDDDDATGPDDDDDVAPLEDVAQVTFTGEFDPFCEDDVCFSEVAFGIHYWTSLADDDLACTQRLVAAASVTLGFGGVPGCGNCSAGFAIDPDSWIDATDPDDDPAHCDLAALNAADLNYGEAFTAPAGSFPGALGDFNAGGFQSAGVHAALNHDYYAAGGLTAEAMTAAYADLGLVYAGLIFWDGSIDDSAAQSLLDAGLFVPEGESAAFVPAFFVWFDPEENPAADPDEATGWIGPHGASSTFLFDVQ